MNFISGLEGEPYSRSLDGFVPADHPLRQLQATLNLSFLAADIIVGLDRRQARPGGRQAVGAETIFRMRLLAYIYDIPSERQLCSEVQVNLAFRWFVGIGLDQKVPDHSTFSRFRRRIGKARFELILGQVIAHYRSVRTEAVTK